MSKNDAKRVEVYINPSDLAAIANGTLASTQPVGIIRLDGDEFRTLFVHMDREDKGKVYRTKNGRVRLNAREQTQKDAGLPAGITPQMALELLQKLAGQVQAPTAAAKSEDEDLAELARQLEL